MIKNFTLLLFLFSFFNAFSQAPVIVDTVTGNEKLLTEFNGNLYFARSDSVFLVSPYNQEIKLLAYLQAPIVNPGKPEERSYYNLDDFPTTDNHIFFTTNSNEDYQYELWMSDGTTAGTKSIFLSDQLSGFIEFKNHLYFVAGNNPNFSSGAELYRVEGDGSVTEITDINSGPESSFSENPKIAATNNTLYFTASNGSSGIELWQSKGVQYDAELIADLKPGEGSSIFYELLTTENDLYFLHNEEDKWEDNSLFVYKNSELKLLVSSEINALLEDLTLWNNSVLVKKNDSRVTGYAYLIKVDGATGDTTLIASTNGANNFIPMGNQLFFTDFVDGNATELYKADGTPEGTERYYNMTAGHTLLEFVKVDDLVVFSHETNPFYLSQTDLTKEGD